VKIRDHATGRVWEINYIVAADEFGTTRRFYGAFDLVTEAGNYIGTASSGVYTAIPEAPSADPDWLKSELQKKDAQIAQLQLSVTSLGERLDQLETTANHFNP
jgi:hypothetical protein